MALHTNCESMTRRDCLRLGLGALVGGGLVDALRLRGEAALAGSRPTSCILIWMDGGPSHYETFDPKPDAPKEIRGEFSPIATSVPGISLLRARCSGWRRSPTSSRSCARSATTRATTAPATTT